MNKVIVNNASVNGTCLQGYVKTTLRVLKSILGKPEYEEEYGYPMDKVTTEWNLTFPCGTVATIYDWKLPRQPSYDEEYEWHVGGNGKIAEVLVNRLINGEEKYEIENKK